jgi:pimeloyl-ACP methyl ester carboxylesterase
VLLCHGNASNVAKEEWRMAGLRDLGYAVLAFDYSGYGKSSGVPSERQMYKDASIMLALLLTTHDPSYIVVYGFSIGAPVAAYVAGRYGIPTLVLESPLSSMREVMRRRYRFMGFIAELCPEFDTAAHLARFHGAAAQAGPVGPKGPMAPNGAPSKLAQRRRSLVMHGPADEIVPYESVAKLISMCTKHIQIGGTHDRPVLPWEQIGAFVGA